MGIFQYLRNIMGMDTPISEDVVEVTSEPVPAPAEAVQLPARKPGRPAKAYQKKVQPIGGKKL
jgi:hypothetical protein